MVLQILQLRSRHVTSICFITAASLTVNKLKYVFNYLSLIIEVNLFENWNLDCTSEYFLRK